MAKAREQHDIVQWLSQPAAYAHRPESVEHIETHISHVFLAGAYAYKLKKSVKYDFLDFSTIAERERACREELRLNRRLASGTYLRVVPVTRSAEGKLELSSSEPSPATAEVVDWLVEMRRLPTELTLDSMQRRGELSFTHVERLSDTLIRFYQALVPLALSPEEYRHRYLQHVGGNLAELLTEEHGLERTAVLRAHSFQLQLLQLGQELFDQRVRSGRIVDGHGDLRPEHICLTDPIAIFDCIEFSPEFRRIDVVDELAFLAEECDCLGARWVGPQLLTSYQIASGDRPPAVLVDFYKSYRASVRAKVAALRARQLDAEPRDRAGAEARRHLALADDYAAAWLRPLVLAVGGLSGTGKTTLATALAEALGAELLRTDTIRQTMFGAGPHADREDAGIYHPEARLRVYAEMIARLEPLHAARISVVLDGTFSTAQTLRAVETAVTHPGRIFLGVQCVCRKEVALARIGVRLASSTDASEARPDIHDAQRMQWETWPGDLPHIRVDTEQPLDKQVLRVMEELIVMYQIPRVACAGL